MSDTQPNVRHSSVWLLPAATLSLLACYAEIPGSGPVGDSSDNLFPDGGLPGDFGGTLSGGGMGGDLDTGLVDPSDAGVGSDANLVSDCDGVAIGVVQTRKRYAEAQVVSTACQSETQMRTCRNAGWSSWSGTYKAESCVEDTVHSCGDVAHGATATRERYAQDVVTDMALCVVEVQTQECDDGTLSAWTGTATFDTCKIGFLGRCSVLSDYNCVAGTTCPIRIGATTCLGNTGHTCSANAECLSGVCVSGACVASKVPVTGACDEATDCASCATGAASVAATCSTSNVCVCGTGANCNNNNQCQGTCTASRCVAANTTCDNDDDCTATTHKCVKAGAGSGTGTCLLKDGQSCTANAQCEHVCRTPDNDETFAQKICQTRGGSEAHCDENTDCTNAFVCRPVVQQSLPLDKGTHCQSAGQALELCDETSDCAQPSQSTCANVVSSGLVCFPISSGGMGGSGNG